MAKPKEETPGAATKRCIDAFYAAYVRRHNPRDVADAHLRAVAARTPSPISRDELVLPIINGGKDGKLVKQMIEAWGERRVIELIDLFFGDAYTSPRVFRSRQDVGALYYVAPFLLTGTESLTQKDAENLDAVARATGRRKS